MALDIHRVSHACNQIAREIRDYQKNQTIQFIVHQEGQRLEALTQATQDIMGHPAAETALHILRKPRKSEHSAFLGTAVARQNIFFGLSSRYSILSLCTINIDQFSTMKEVCRHAYHLAWHAMDSASFHADPRNRSGNSTDIIIRKRNALEMAEANLNADIFSCAVSYLHHDLDAACEIAQLRGRESMSAKTLHNPEYYPFVIALDATEFVLGQTNSTQITRKKVIPAALKIASDVAGTFDEIQLKNWIGFVEPAQDMAWRGLMEDDILGAAINTSPNTYIRAIGYMISETLKIKPASALRVQETYSLFADNQFNEQIHKRIIGEIFEDVIAQGLKQNSHVPFLALAYEQNESLTEGKIIGWCASALYDAGAAYEKAKGKGADPLLYAREEFECKRDNTKWNDLRKLGKRIIQSHRQGATVSMEDLKNLSKGIEGLKNLMKSVEKTLTDSHYRQKKHEHDWPKPKTRGMQQTSELQSSPSLSIHNFSAPGFGSTMRNAPPVTIQEATEDRQN